jgi:hypothetical protein
MRQGRAGFLKHGDEQIFENHHGIELLDKLKNNKGLKEDAVGYCSVSYGSIKRNDTNTRTLNFCCCTRS